MLTVKECLEFCDLTDDEISAIAEHEHVPDVVAAELGECLLKTDLGAWVIKRFIIENIEHAESHGRPEKAVQFRAVLAHFDATHPTYNLSRQ